MRPAQLPLPQQNGRLLQDSHPSASSEDSSSSSPTLFPVTTPASSGVPSPTDEVKQADMLTPHAALENVTRSTRALFEQWRPTSHFLGPHGWMNDPCGPSYDPRTRLYHLWYQWNPNASTWGSICWGHAYSYDMIHWTSRPYPVIEPGSNHDSEGVFTGCVLHRAPLGTAAEAAETGEMTAIYTAVSKLPIHHTLPYNFGSEKVVLSTSKDGGETWVPHGSCLTGRPSISMLFRGATLTSPLGRCSMLPLVAPTSSLDCTRSLPEVSRTPRPPFSPTRSTTPTSASGPSSARSPTWAATTKPPPTAWTSARTGRWPTSSPSVTRLGPRRQSTFSSTSRGAPSPGPRARPCT